jgi:hypothetical protein
LRTYAAKVSPPSVATMPRPALLNKAVPRAASRAEIAADTAGGVTWRVSAAAPTLPPSSGYKHLHPGRGRFPLPTPTKVTVSIPEPIFPGVPELDLAIMRFDPEMRNILAGDGRFNAFSEDDLASPWVYANGDVHAGTQVLSAGYPSFGGRSDVSRPILVGGIVASAPRLPGRVSNGDPAQQCSMSCF